MKAQLPETGRQLLIDAALVTVKHAEPGEGDSVEVFVVDANGAPQRLILSTQQLADALIRVARRISEGGPLTTAAPAARSASYRDHAQLLADAGAMNIFSIRLQPMVGRPTVPAGQA